MATSWQPASQSHTKNLARRQYPVMLGYALCPSQLRLECLSFKLFKSVHTGQALSKMLWSHKLTDSETNIHKNFSLILEMLWENKKYRQLNITSHFTTTTFKTLESNRDLGRNEQYLRQVMLGIPMQKLIAEVYSSSLGFSSPIKTFTHIY